MLQGDGLSCDLLVQIVLVSHWHCAEVLLVSLWEPHLVTLLLSLCVIVNISSSLLASRRDLNIKLHSGRSRGPGGHVWLMAVFNFLIDTLIEAMLYIGHLCLTCELREGIYDHPTIYDPTTMYDLPTIYDLTTVQLGVRGCSRTLFSFSLSFSNFVFDLTHCNSY